jgi:hypothetical protein
VLGLINDAFDTENLKLNLTKILWWLPLRGGLQILIAPKVEKRF